MPKLVTSSVGEKLVRWLGLAPAVLASAKIDSSLD